MANIDAVIIYIIIYIANFICAVTYLNRSPRLRRAADAFANHLQSSLGTLAVDG